MYFKKTFHAWMGGNVRAGAGGCEQERLRASYLRGVVELLQGVARAFPAAAVHHEGIPPHDCEKNRGGSDETRSLQTRKTSPQQGGRFMARDRSIADDVIKFDPCQKHKKAHRVKSVMITV